MRWDEMVLIISFSFLFFFCGEQAIGVDHEGKPCATVLEAAKRPYHFITPSFLQPDNGFVTGKGYKTGLVVTSRITHVCPLAPSLPIFSHVLHSSLANPRIQATPAGFASHVIHRDFESSIASQLVGKTHPLGQTVDILMGGGLCFFLPMGVEGTCFFPLRTSYFFFRPFFSFRLYVRSFVLVTDKFAFA